METNIDDVTSIDDVKSIDDVTNIDEISSIHADTASTSQHYVTSDASRQSANTPDEHNKKTTEPGLSQLRSDVRDAPTKAISVSSKSQVPRLQIVTSVDDDIIEIKNISSIHCVPSTTSQRTSGSVTSTTSKSTSDSDTMNSDSSHVIKTPVKRLSLDDDSSWTSVTVTYIDATSSFFPGYDADADDEQSSAHDDSGGDTRVWTTGGGATRGSPSRQRHGKATSPRRVATSSCRVATFPQRDPTLARHLPPQARLTSTPRRVVVSPQQETTLGRQQPHNSTSGYNTARSNV